MDELDRFEKGSTFTIEELAAIDPVMGADSVMLDKLLRTIHNVRVSARQADRLFADALVRMQTAWLFHDQGDDESAWAWIEGFLAADFSFADDEHARNPRDYHAWHAPGVFYHTLCALPACRRPAGMGHRSRPVCSQRHLDALEGRLPDEECRWCHQVRPCPFELEETDEPFKRGRKPICAECWPTIARQLGRPVDGGDRSV